MARRRGRGRRREQREALARRAGDEAREQHQAIYEHDRNRRAIETTRLTRREDPGALAAFYDDHQPLALGVTAVAAGAAGMTLNARLGPVTPLDLQPSTVAAIGCGLVAFAAHRRKAHRAKRLALAATVGLVGATAHARAKAGGLLANARADDVSGDAGDDTRGAGKDDGSGDAGHRRSGAPPV